jgi:hypothetical protein
VIPQVLGTTAGFTAGGAAGSFTAGALLAPGKAGKPPTLTERATFGGQAALRSVVPSAVTGIAWGLGSAIAGTVLPAFIKSRWNPETGPAYNEAFTQEAAGRARAAGVELTPEEVGRFSQRFGQIQRAPQAAKPALWRRLASDWNGFIEARKLPGVPPDVAGGTPSTGSLGPAPAQLPGATFFGGASPPGPTITTPAGLAWDLRTRPLTDLEGLHAQLGQLQAAGTLTPEQQADYARLQSLLDANRNYQAQQHTPPVSEAAKSAITEALTAPRLLTQFEIAPLRTAAAAAGDTPVGQVLAAARDDQQRVVAQTLNRSFAPPDHPLIQGPLGPLLASPYRQLTPEQVAGLPADARRSLLLQDLNNSIQVVHPGALPYFSLPPNVKAPSRTWRISPTGTTARRPVTSSLTFPAPQVLYHGAGRAAAPAPEVPAPSPAGGPDAGSRTWRRGRWCGFPNGLTVRLRAVPWMPKDGRRSPAKCWSREQQRSSGARTAPFDLPRTCWRAGRWYSPAEGLPSAPTVRRQRPRRLARLPGRPLEPAATAGPSGLFLADWYDRLGVEWAAFCDANRGTDAPFDDLTTAARRSYEYHDWARRLRRYLGAGDAGESKGGSEGPVDRDGDRLRIGGTGGGGCPRSGRWAMGGPGDVQAGTLAGAGGSGPGAPAPGSDPAGPDPVRLPGQRPALARSAARDRYRAFRARWRAEHPGGTDAACIAAFWHHESGLLAALGAQARDDGDPAGQWRYSRAAEHLRDAAERLADLATVDDGDDPEPGNGEGA